MRNRERFVMVSIRAKISRNCKGKSKDFFGILCSISYDSEYYLHLLLRALYVYHNCVKT